MTYKVFSVTLNPTHFAASCIPAKLGSCVCTVLDTTSTTYARAYEYSEDERRIRCLEENTTNKQRIVFHATWISIYLLSFTLATTTYRRPWIALWDCVDRPITETRHNPLRHNPPVKTSQTFPKTNVTTTTTRMWVNAQRDGRPAEYRWRPLFNAAKFGWRPYYSAVRWRCQDAKPLEISWGAPHNRTDLSRLWADVRILWWHVEEILLLNKFFFQIVDTYLSVAKI